MAFANIEEPWYFTNAKGRTAGFGTCLIVGRGPSAAELKVPPLCDIRPNVDVIICTHTPWLKHTDIVTGWDQDGGLPEEKEAAKNGYTTIILRGWKKARRARTFYDWSGCWSWVDNKILVDDWTTCGGYSIKFAAEALGCHTIHTVGLDHTMEDGTCYFENRDKMLKCSYGAMNKRVLNEIVGKILADGVRITKQEEKSRLGAVTEVFDCRTLFLNGT